MNVLAVFVLALVASPCLTKSVPEDDSVVSVYTSQTSAPGTAGTSGLGVYRQIAFNVAEKISSPFYRLFGIEHNKTDEQTTTKKPWGALEIFNDTDPPKFTQHNKIDRDIEELSDEAFTKTDSKPEKVTLYNSYLPVKENLERNDSMNAIDSEFEDGFSLDDVSMTEATKTNPFIFVVELIASAIQLIWGGLQSIFKPSS